MRCPLNRWKCDAIKIISRMRMRPRIHWLVIDQLKNLIKWRSPSASDSRMAGISVTILWEFLWIARKCLRYTSVEIVKISAIKIFPITTNPRKKVSFGKWKSPIQTLTHESKRRIIGVDLRSTKIARKNTHDRLIIIILVYHCSIRRSMSLVSSPMENDLKSHA